MTSRLLAACLVLVSVSALPQGSLSGGFEAPLDGLQHADTVKDHFIVHFHDTHDLDLHSRSIGSFSHNLPNFQAIDDLGYTATLDAKTLKLVRADPGVQLVEADRYVTYDHSLQDNSTAAELPSLRKRAFDFVEQTGKVGYNRRQVQAETKLSPLPVGDDGTYKMLSPAGDGVDVYIFDSGVRLSHEQFQGRAKNFNDIKPGNDAPYCPKGTSIDDQTGHGTHVAGIVAGQFTGIAPNANIISVKVLCPGGTLSEMARAIREVAAAHKQKVNTAAKSFRGSVINMSLSYDGYNALVAASLKRATDAGISIFAAAGNQNGDAKALERYPCGYDYASCVAATDQNYQRLVEGNKGSNWGEWINFVAPGKEIASLSHKDDKAIVYMSGTSQATPHVAGIAAIYTAWRGLCDNSAKDYIKLNAQKGLTGGWPSATPDFFTFTGINAKARKDGEPFINGGTQRNPGLKTDNIFRPNLDAAYGKEPTFQGEFGSTNKVPDRPTGDKASDGDQSMTNGAASTDKVNSADVKSQQSDPRWLVSAFTGDITSGSGCGGSLVSSSTGVGDSTCFKTQKEASCVQAQTLSGSKSCVVELYSDSSCQKPFRMKRGATGVFGSYANNAALGAGGNTFNSYHVLCKSV